MYWLIKITATVPEAQAVQAAHAIGVWQHPLLRHSRNHALISLRACKDYAWQLAMAAHHHVAVLQDHSASVWNQWSNSRRSSPSGYMMSWQSRCVCSAIIACLASVLYLKSGLEIDQTCHALCYSNPIWMLETITRDSAGTWCT